MQFVKTNLYYILLFALFLFYLVFATIVPFTQDDWDWFLHAYQYWQEHFSTLNGRYIGNVIEIFAVKSMLFRILFYAFISISILWMILRIIHKEKSVAYLLLAFTALLLMPSQIFKQIYAWFAGFNNYATSALCVLIILFVIVKTVTTKEKTLDRNSLVETIIFWFACLTGQLLMENVTLYNMAMIAIAIVQYFVVYRKLNLKLLIGFVLTMIGAVMMFTNPNYMNILAGKTTYQQVKMHMTLMEKMRDSLFNVITFHGYFNIALFLTALALLLIFVLYRSPQFIALKPLYKGLLTGAIAYFSVYKYFVYDAFHLELMTHLPWVSLLNFIACLMFVISIAIGVYFVGFSKEKLYTVYFSLASIIILNIPLLVVSPVGPRNFYLSYILWLIILLLILERCQWSEVKISWVTGIIASVACMMYLSAFSLMTYVNHQRIEKIQYEVTHDSKKKEYVVEGLPFETYSQHATPISNRGAKLFKAYWHIPKDAKLKFVPYGNDYLEKEKEQK